MWSIEHMYDLTAQEIRNSHSEHATEAGNAITPDSVASNCKHGSNWTKSNLDFSIYMYILSLVHLMTHTHTLPS